MHVAFMHGHWVPLELILRLKVENYKNILAKSINVVGR